MLLLWIAVFIASLVVLVKGADWLLESAEHIGLAVGLSPFIVGVTIVAAGTSLPELVSSGIATLQGLTEFAPANAVGSNIANILLIIGIAAIAAKKPLNTRGLFDADLLFFAASTLMFLIFAWDGQISRIESGGLLGAFILYLAITIFYKEKPDDPAKRPKITGRTLAKFIIGMAAIALGASYMIDSVVAIADILAIGTGTITLIAIAFGTSLPELIVSLKAARKGKADVALGNILGSNIFNILVVVGLPGTFVSLGLDKPTLELALPVLIAATILFYITGFRRKIHRWEGSLYLAIYVYFILRLVQ